MKQCIHTEIETGAKHIPLTKGFCAVVDEEDYGRVAVYGWHYCAGYAMRGRGGELPMMRCLHNWILPPRDGFTVDHIESSLSLDNRKSNLRYATREQQMQNRRTSKDRRVKGVGPSSNFRKYGHAKRPWEAYIRLGGKIKYIGSFITEEEAAIAYDAEATKNFGEFARLNFIRE